MQKRELVASMVTSSKSALASLGLASKKTVSVKIRIHKDLRHTIDFVKTVQEAGVDFITIHGRMRSTRSSDPVNLEAIKLVGEHVRCPKLSNGDVWTRADARRHVEETGVDGVMAARGILENPAMFDGEGRGDRGCPWEAVEVFMGRVVRAPVPWKLVVHHLSEMVGSDRVTGTVGGGRGTLVTKEERMGLMGCESMLEVVDWLDGVKEVRRL